MADAVARTARVDATMERSAFLSHAKTVRQVALIMTAPLRWCEDRVIRMLSEFVARGVGSSGLGQSSKAMCSRRKALERSKAEATELFSFFRVDRSLFEPAWCFSRRAYSDTPRRRSSCAPNTNCRCHVILC